MILTNIGLLILNCENFQKFQKISDAKHIDDIEIAILRQQIDVFISYRRSTGNQLASLIKVLLQLRGYKVAEWIFVVYKEMGQGFGPRS